MKQLEKTTYLLLAPPAAWNAKSFEQREVSKKGEKTMGLKKLYYYLQLNTEYNFWYYTGEPFGPEWECPLQIIEVVEIGVQFHTLVCDNIIPRYSNNEPIYFGGPINDSYIPSGILSLLLEEGYLIKAEEHIVSSFEYGIL